MISINNLQKSYSGQKVLDISYLEIKDGESLGIVGNNGAGKTTLFRLILDLIRPGSGEITIKDFPVKGSNHWKNYTGSYLDQNFLIDFLTPEEYFEFLRGVYKMSKGDLEEFLQKFESFFNGEVMGKKKYIRELSQGNRQKTGIAAAMMSRPELIILDEPYNGLDPSTQLRLVKMLRDLQESTPVTMLISSHDLRHITEVCERVVILEKGVIKHDIRTSEATLKELETYFNPVE